MSACEKVWDHVKWKTIHDQNLYYTENWFMSMCELQIFKRSLQNLESKPLFMPLEVAKAPIIIHR